MGIAASINTPLMTISLQTTLMPTIADRLLLIDGSIYFASNGCLVPTVPTLIGNAPTIILA